MSSETSGMGVGGQSAGESPGRSRMLEIIGVLAAIGFFVGIYFAWRTQVGSLITSEQFDQIEMGQTLAEVEDVLGTAGTPEADKSDNTQGETYVWENSSDSRIVCVFVNGELAKKSAVNLP